MQRPQLSRQHISSPLTVVDSDDEEGPVVEGWSIFENSTDSSSSAVQTSNFRRPTHRRDVVPVLHLLDVT